jgi:hypothetical protein
MLIYQDINFKFNHSQLGRFNASVNYLNNLELQYFFPLSSFEIKESWATTKTIAEISV